MEFDVIKRQTIEKRLNEIIEQTKFKMNEKEIVKIFNHLIEDSNNRVEKKEQIEFLKDNNNNNNNKNIKKYKTNEWNKIYENRFLQKQKSYKNKILNEIKIKKENEEKKEKEIINLCKSKKKSQKEIEKYAKKLYDEYKIRKIKLNNKLNFYKNSNNNNNNKHFKKNISAINLKAYYNNNINININKSIDNKILKKEKEINNKKIKKSYSQNKKMILYDKNDIIKHDIKTILKNIEKTSKENIFINNTYENENKNNKIFFNQKSKKIINTSLNSFSKISYNDVGISVKNKNLSNKIINDFFINNNNNL